MTFFHQSIMRIFGPGSFNHVTLTCCRRFFHVDHCTWRLSDTIALQERSDLSQRACQRFLSAFTTSTLKLSMTAFTSISSSKCSKPKRPAASFSSIVLPGAGCLLEDAQIRSTSWRSMLEAKRETSMPRKERKKTASYRIEHGRYMLAYSCRVGAGAGEVDFHHRRKKPLTFVREEVFVLFRETAFLKV